MKATKENFLSMVSDYIADNAEELEDLTIDSTERIDGAWIAYAHDSTTNYMLFDEGAGEIDIKYLDAR